MEPKIRSKIEDREFIDQYTKRQILAECGHKCAHCGKQLTLGKTFTVDHVIPLDKAGTNDMTNFVAMCEDCNLEKGNKVVYVPEYFPHLPKDKMKQVLAYTEKYMAERDWLQFDNLLPYDWFPVTLNLPILINRGTKIGYIKRNCIIRKLTPEETIAMLAEYIPVVQGPSVNIFWTRVDEVQQDHPYYEVIDKNTGYRYFGFGLYINKVEFTYVDKTKTRNCMYIDFIRNPKSRYIQQKSALEVEAMLTMIQQQVTISCRSKIDEDCMLQYLVRAPIGDQYAVNTFSELNYMYPKTYGIQTLTAEATDNEPAIIALDSFLAMMSRKQAKRDKNGAYVEYTMEELDEAQSKIDQKLETAQAAKSIRDKELRQKRDLEEQIAKVIKPGRPVRKKSSKKKKR